MNILIAFVFFLALFMSLAYVNKLVQFILQGSNGQNATIAALQTAIPAFLWAVFYYLVN